jgi:hypothetical protein
LRTTLRILALMAPAVAFAQDENVRYQDRTEIDFEEVDVSGELVKPQGQLLLERRRASFNPLITLRENFNEEMRTSLDEVK